MDYWDSSALIKLYLAESDSIVYDRIVAESTEETVVSEIAEPEILCALRRRELDGSIPRGAPERIYRKVRAHIAAGRVELIPYGSQVTAEVERVVKIAYRDKGIPVRAIDAIHMATARLVGARRMVTADKRLGALASELGMSVAPSPPPAG